MKTVAVIAQKGGAGKTTLSIATACAALRERRPAAIVDLDPQASATSWADRRDRDVPVVLPAQPPRLAKILEAAAGEGIELAVLDTAPRAEQSAVAAARAADVAVVPCRPAVVDLETVVTTFELIRAVNPGVPAVCVLNAVPARGPLAHQARLLLAEAGVPVADTTIGHRIAINHASTLGLDPGEYEPAGKAAAELNALYLSIAKLIA